MNKKALIAMSGGGERCRQQRGGLSDEGAGLRMHRCHHEIISKR